MILPLGDQIEFVDLRTGKVHVLAYIDPDAPVETRRIGDGPRDAIAVSLGAVVTRCGRQIWRHYGGFDASAHLTTTFPDDRLCGGCHRTVAPEEQHRLFEHPQGDTGDETALDG